MSDFDAVLERLVTDQAFAVALATDPATALAGYRLDPDEIQLLHSQVGGDAGGQRTVEVRANQSSLFGMLSPLAGMVGGLPGIGDLADSGAGEGTGKSAGDGAGKGASDGIGTGVGDGVGTGVGDGAGRVEDSGFGPAGQGGFGPAGRDWFGPAGEGGFGAAGTDPASPPAEGFGAATHGAGFGAADGTGPIGSVYAGGLYQGGGLSSLGDEIGEALRSAGAGQADAGDITPPEGYRTDVDMDGDGRDDKHVLRGRADGGVDILVDSDRDGRVDIIGHDADADGLVESAEYDKDGDGHFEKHMYDDNDDGWLDRTVIDKRPPAAGPGAGPVDRDQRMP